MAHSYSSISTFEKCPREYEARYVTKTVKFTGNEHTRRGDRIHKALELYIKGETDTPPAPSEAPADGLHEVLRALRAHAPVEVEQSLAVTKDLEPCGFWDKEAYLRGKLDVNVQLPEVIVGIDWKGLALDTPLPTPTGWTTMRDVAVGDLLVGRDGFPCAVIGKSTVRRGAGYRIIFDDTTSVVCDDQHLWVTGRGIVPVTNLRLGDTVPLAHPVQGQRLSLPLDPYVLGLWLADGKHTSSEITNPDPEVWAEIERRGYILGKPAPTGKCRAQSVLGIRGVLRNLGILGNKHIPTVYLRASYSQRLDLLRGLMDGDGNANPVRKQAVFTTCDKGLSDQVYELLCSLGQRVNQACTRQRGFGLEVTAYPLAFRPQNGLNPFLLPRKAERIDPEWGPGRSSVRKVRSITPVEDVESQCVAVDSPDNTYLCTRSFLPTHNSGKRSNNKLQAAVYSTMLQAHAPDKQVITYFDYLDKGRDEPIRGDKGDITEVMAKAAAVDAATVFPPRPSRLCGWCPVKNCEFNES